MYAATSFAATVNGFSSRRVLTRPTKLLTASLPRSAFRRLEQRKPLLYAKYAGGKPDLLLRSAPVEETVLADRRPLGVLRFDEPSRELAKVYFLPSFW